ncbi:hypothetical protein [Winogradskyella sp. PE311]|uniref:hypothetical protein n=1 Tax=Winogradskyella sp. PE311 TaxID=3366943 RepID=UPI0039803E83
MKVDNEMNNKVQNTLESGEFIGEVEVSPFFKESVMHRIRNESEVVTDLNRSWFTPKLQLATLACVIILNIVAFNEMRTSTYDEDVNDFAESYGLSTNIESSILY